jgi:hypothetical protein
MKKKECVQAEKVMNELLRLSEMVLGKDNPRHLSYQLNLASILSSQKKYDEAISQLKLLIPRMKRITGLTAYDTLAAIQNYAAILIMTKKAQEAEPLLLEAYKGCQQVLGPKHEKTRTVLENLIELYRALGKQDKVNEYQQELDKLKH